jgi:FMN phosphatase YigB (HAD superfamily)
MTKTPAIIFDIDGTLADITHRLHHIQKLPKDWDSFHADAGKDIPYPLCMFAAGMCQSFLYCDSLVMPLFVTGRDKSQYQQTFKWIQTNIDTDYICAEEDSLFMRPEGNREDDTIVKRRIYEEQIAPCYDVIAVFEDRPRVISMWREIGLTVYDCNKTGGEF